MKEILLQKRNGTKEALDIQKIHKVVQWACEGVNGVSPSEIEAQAQLKFYQGMKTSDLHASLIEATHELINEDTPNYDLVAGRLLMFDIRKRAYGDFEVPHLVDIIKKNTSEGFYDPNLLGMYTLEEWDEINTFINHDLDFKFKISGAREWFNKYLIQNRKTQEYKETPQIAYILIASILMKKYQPLFGLTMLKEYYEDISLGDTTLPSPLSASIRSAHPQGASCVLIETGDSLKSITATVDAAVKYAANKAGLGIGIFNLRAEKQAVRGGANTTTGPIPFGQLISAAIASCSQGGIRKGSGTLYHTIFHMDIEKLLVLKNNRGTEESRIRNMDHAFNMNGYLLRKIFKGEGQMALFSPETVPDLMKAFYDDQVEFARLYEKYSADKTTVKKFVDCEVIRDLFVNERLGTSRIYFHFVDNANEQGSFIPAKAPIRMSNLCTEIELPTIPLETFDDPDGLISLCTLSAQNWGNLKVTSDLERRCRNTIFALDSLLDFQPYLLKAAQNSTDWYRPLGVGVNNLAYFLAKRGLKYSKEAAIVVDEFMEAQAYYLTKASIELAKLYGPCGKVENTKYGKGIFPMDVRKSAIDEIIPHNPRMDWEPLRDDAIKYGIRNATNSAHMPAETSSRIHGFTNGGEPLRKGIVVKQGSKQVAPEYAKLKNKYDYEFDMDMEGYIYVMGALQKWSDQGISVNTRYDPTKYPDNQIPGKLVLKHIGMTYKCGLKTGYYNNNKKVLSSEAVAEEVIEEVVLPEVVEEDCEACQV